MNFQKFKAENKEIFDNKYQENIDDINTLIDLQRKLEQNTNWTESFKSII